MGVFVLVDGGPDRPGGPGGGVPAPRALRGRAARAQTRLCTLPSPQVSTTPAPTLSTHVQKYGTV